VWSLYGITETAAVIAVPLLRRCVGMLLPSLGPSQTGPFTTPILTATALAAYPMAGALLGVLVAICVGRRFTHLSTEKSHYLWSSVGGVTLTVAFGANGLIARQYYVLIPALLALIFLTLGIGSALRTTYTSRWRSVAPPTVIVLLLIGGSLIGQPRLNWGTWLTTVGVLCYTGVTLALSVAVSRVWRHTPPPLRALAVPSRVPLRRAAASLTMLALVAVSQQDPSDWSTRTPSAFNRTDLPNIILVTLDTVRADHLSLYGYTRETTAALERLERNGATVYLRAFSSSNYTLPSHASIFTGQSPRHHGAYPTESAPSGFALSRDAVTSAGELQRNGYRTVAIVSNFGVLTAAHGFDTGFSSFLVLSRHERPGLLLAGIRKILDEDYGGEAVYVRATEVTVRAVRFIEDTDQNGPFFLFLNLTDAHNPYVPPAPFNRMFPGRVPTFSWVAFNRYWTNRQMTRAEDLAPPERQHLVSQYDGAIAYMDSSLERVCDVLQRRGLFEKTLIVITSDHGEALGESNLLFHGTSLYNHQIHVPLIIKFPYSTGGRRTDVLASGVDIFPTILDVAGLPIPPTVEGESLLRKRSLEKSWVTSESYTSRGEKFASGDQRPAEMAIVVWPYKEIVGNGGGVELYDLSTDSGEKNNIAKQTPFDATLQKKLSEMLQEKRSPSLGGRVTDPEILERLRSLGYIR